MGKALYRRYRPRSLDELVGQEHITKLLAAAISRGAISHAYLFTGPRGIGKTSVARILAHQINQLDYSDDPHLDIIEIDAASNRRIDDIRDLREKTHIAPSSAQYKVYIIDEVHMLTGESFNALLKTLEEPPAHVVFILATTELHKVPLTIVSRTQRFHFRPVATELVAKHLQSIAKKEKQAIDDDALQLIAQHGGGSLRDSVGLLDQLMSSQEKTITHQMIESILGLAPVDQVRGLAQAIADRDYQAAVTTLNQLLAQGTSAQTITEQLLTIVPELALQSPHLYELLDELLDIPRSYRPHLKLLALVAKHALPVTTTAHKVVPELVSPLSTMTLDVSLPITPKTPPPADTTKKAPSKSLQDFDWQHILESLQQRNPPLHSVLRRAEATFHNDCLRLEFDFNLHRKKLENHKYRSPLISLITDTYGSCPELVIVAKTLNSAPLEGTAANVAELMGGGELVAL